MSFQGPVKKSRCPEKGKKNPILSRTWFLLSLKVWWRGYLLQEAPLAPQTGAPASRDITIPLRSECYLTPTAPPGQVFFSSL